MKKLYVLFVTVCCCGAAHAQLKKGAIALGGNLSYSDATQTSSNGTDYTYRTRGLSVAPAFGKMIKDNLMFGFDIDYTNTKYDYPMNQTNTANGFGAGIFIRKYKSLGNGFYLFGQSRLGGSYSHSGIDEPTGNEPTRDVTNSYGFSLQFLPGIAYSLSRKWQLEAGLPNFFAVNYAHTTDTQSFTTQPDVVNKSSNFSIQSSLAGNNSLSVGLRYFIGN
ncbi:hypothetical protein [Puia sp.]|jgi:hypothetical protein|uniref:hypothetical protein n=1 Tax=Puia sp. TaxID=2045100 RepID=UPI002F4146D7